MEIPRVVFILVDKDKSIDSVFYEGAAAMAQAQTAKESLDILTFTVTDADDILGFDESIRDWKVDPNA